MFLPRRVLKRLTRHPDISAAVRLLAVTCLLTLTTWLRTSSPYSMQHNIRDVSPPSPGRGTALRCGPHHKMSGDMTVHQIPFKRVVSASFCSC